MTSECAVCGREVPTVGQCRKCSKRSPRYRATVTSVETTKLVLLFDLHVPEHDRKMFHAILAFLEDYKPDEIVIGGDFLELVSCSMHSWNDGSAQLELDVEAGRTALTALRAAAPNAKMTYLEGNHETRLTRFLMEKAPTLTGAITLPEKLDFAGLNITWVPEGAQPIHRGTLDILHGHQLGTGGGYGLPKYHTAKAVAVYGQPNRRILYGHTHTDQESGQTTYQGRATAKSFGCGRSLQPAWLRGAPSGWMHEFGVAVIGPDDMTQLYCVKPVDGKFVFDGKLYVGR